MLKRFSKNQTSDLTLSQVQDSLINCLNPVFTNPMLDGVLVKNVILAAGTNVIPNPIQREVQGVMTLLKSTFADIHTGAQASNPSPTRTLILTSSAAVTVDLWIF